MLMLLLRKVYISMDLKMVIYMLNSGLCFAQVFR